jgi:hypothetical protein
MEGRAGAGRTGSDDSNVSGAQTLRISTSLLAKCFSSSAMKRSVVF